MKKAILFVIVVLAVAALLVVNGIQPRLRARQRLSEETVQAAAPAVTVSKPRHAPPAEEVVLPCNIEAYVDAPIYARTNGYLKRWYFDIGAHVKAGQLLAEIESPEIDQQRAQAEQTLESAKADLKLAQITSERYVDLYKSDSVAKQEVDNAVQNAASHQATVKAAQANVDRLNELVGFENLYAPFTGVVTARQTDIGQLVSEGSAQTHELFHVASIDRLRVFIDVPQIYSASMKVGLNGDLIVPETPSRRFPGKIVRTSNAFNPATRTIRVEVDVPNPKYEIFPGSFAEMHFKMQTPTSTLIIPSTSLIFRAQGLRVPVVRDDQTVMLPVTTGRDFGNTIEILSGLTGNELIINNPPDSLVAGEKVRVMPAKTGSEESD